MDLHQRLGEFLHRLQAAAPAGTAEEALELVCRIIEEVEDELCPIARETPPPFLFTGRMYAPKGDRIQRFADGTMVATTRRHRIYCRPNGAIAILQVLSRTIVLNK